MYEWGDVVDEVGDGSEGLGIGHVDGDVVGGFYRHDEVDDVDGFKTEVGLESEVGSDGVERDVVEEGGHYLGYAGENFFVHCYSGFCSLLFWILFLYAVGKGGSDVFPWCHVEVGGEWVVIAYEGDFGVIDVIAIYDIEGEWIGRGDGEGVEMDVTNGKLTDTLDVGSGVVGGVVLAEVVDACVDLLLEGGVPLLRLLEIDVGKVDVVEEGSETAGTHTDVEGGYGLVDIQDALAGIPGEQAAVNKTFVRGDYLCKQTETLALTTAAIGIDDGFNDIHILIIYLCRHGKRHARCGIIPFVLFSVAKLRNCHDKVGTFFYLCGDIDICFT